MVIPCPTTLEALLCMCGRRLVEEILSNPMGHLGRYDKAIARGGYKISAGLVVCRAAG